MRIAKLKARFVDLNISNEDAVKGGDRMQSFCQRLHKLLSDRPNSFAEIAKRMLDVDAIVDR